MSAARKETVAWRYWPLERPHGIPTLERGNENCLGLSQYDFGAAQYGRRRLWRESSGSWPAPDCALRTMDSQPPQ